MDKYPVFREEQTVGELTVAPDALYTAFSVSCRGREGLWCAWAVGERESLRIGVLEPENGCLQIRRRFSKRLTDPLGPILRGELRPLGEEREQWEPLRPELLRSPYLRCRLGGLSDVLTVTIKDGNKVLYSGTANELTKQNVVAADDTLKIGQRRNLTAVFHYPENSGNETQNLNLTFTLCAEATQTKNNPNKLFD